MAFILESAGASSSMSAKHTRGAVSYLSLSAAVDESTKRASVSRATQAQKCVYIFFAERAARSHRSSHSRKYGEQPVETVAITENVKMGRVC